MTINEANTITIAIFDGKSILTVFTRLLSFMWDFDFAECHVSRRRFEYSENMAHVDQI